MSRVIRSIIPTVNRRYKFTRTIRVDPGGNGDFTTLEDAAAHAATITPRDATNYVEIIANKGVYLTPGFTLPTFTALRSRGGGDCGRNVMVPPGLVIIPDAPFVAGDTDWITFDSNTSVNNACFIAPAGYLPANFSADFDFVTYLGPSEANNCAYIVITPYTGTNTLTMLRYASGVVAGNISFIGCNTRAQGASTKWVDFDGMNSLYQGGSFLATTIPATSVSFAGASKVMEVMDTHIDGPAVFDVGAGASMQVERTRLPLDVQRTGAGAFIDVHPTPRQTGAAVAANVTVANATGTIDIEDGVKAITASSNFDYFLQPLASVPIGAIYTLYKTNPAAGTITVKPDGAEFINGSNAGRPLTLQNDFITVQQDGLTGQWLLLAYVNNGISVISNGPKAGVEAPGTFAGSPLTKAVVFGTAFTDANYGITITGEDARTWTYESKLATGFTINANSATALTGDVDWQATKNNS